MTKCYKTKGRHLWLARLLSVLLCVVMLFSVTGCGGSSATSSETSGDISGESTKKPTKTKKPTESTAATTSVTTANGTGTTGAASSNATTTATTAGTVTATKPAPVNSALKAADYIRDIDVHRTRHFYGDDAFPFVSQPGPLIDAASGFNFIAENSNNPLITYTLDEHGFYTGDLMKRYHIGEWAYSFLHIPPGNLTGGGYAMLPEAGYRHETPKDRKDAMRIIKNWLFKQYPDVLNADTKHWDSSTGYFNWNQYGLEWGADCVGAEVGECIMHTQASIAFTRGGGRQYDAPGWIDMSAWYSLEDYFELRGHSPSLSERTAMAGVMGGMASVMAEGGEYSLLTTTVKNDMYVLSPTGRAYKKVVEFIKKNPDVGYTYTPFGIVLDFYHGMAANDRGDFREKSFGYFAYNAGDYMSYNLLDLFFPGGWGTEFDETHYLVNGPYGDTCDTLMQNASQKVLDSYPCLILSGDITFSGNEVNRYVNYVKNGGILIMNTAYLKQFPAYKGQYTGSGTKTITDGAGQVIVYGPDYDVTALDGIIREQLARFVPFTLSEQVEYIINIKDGTMYVTLINNEGFTKVPGKNPVMDMSKTKNVTVTYTGDLAIKEIKEIYTNAAVKQSGNAASVTVKPGDVAVLEFTFK